MLNKIHLGDCLELMKDIGTASIDMILCDLPFGTTKNDWDKVLDFEALWYQYERVIKDNGAIVLFAQAPFDKVLACSNLKLFRYEWIWEKTSATGFLNAQKMPLKAHENILVFYKKLPTYNPIKTKAHKKVSRASHKTACKQSSNYGKQMHTKDYCSDERYPRSVLKFPSDKQHHNLHPTQKPLALVEYFIQTYTNEGEIVLDNCTGSGTTPEGCINLNRQFIAYEKEEYIYKTACERVQRAKGNVGLFEEMLCLN
ncbi:MAG: cytosine methyltransferase [Sulfurimonas sp.]|nr:MAG: cytosine methyltransferase [Sulfurimonas sp.]